MSFAIHCVGQREEFHGLDSFSKKMLWEGKLFDEFPISSPYQIRVPILANHISGPQKFGYNRRFGL